MKIPRKADRYNEKVKEALSGLRQGLAQNENVVSVGRRENPDKRISGHFVTQPMVGVKAEQYKREIPNRIDGIPVATDVRNQPEPVSDEHCENIRNFSNVPGGVQVEGGVNSSGDENAVGTSAYKVTDSFGNPHLLMCAHVAEDKNDLPCSSGVGQRIDQHDQKIGTVSEGNKSGDWAIVDESSDSDISGFDATIQYTKPDPDASWPIKCWYTEKGLTNDVLNGPTIYQQGIMSGHSDGILKELNVHIHWGLCDGSGFFNTDDTGIRTTVEIANGDSGGPIFTESDSSNELELVGYITAIDHDTTEDTITCDADGPNGEVTKEEGYPSYGMPTYYLDNNQNITPVTNCGTC